ncbi:MAG: hypothetical protein ABI887_00060 [Burkholderiales bacterium]
MPEQQHLFPVTALDPEVDQPTVALDAEAGRALAQRLHGRIGLKANPLLEGDVIEEAYWSRQLGAEGHEQRAATRSGHLQRCAKACGEILHGSTPYASPAAAHPQVDGFASRKDEVTDLLRKLRRQMCHSQTDLQRERAPREQ